jgi:hypothetical protein
VRHAALVHWANSGPDAGDWDAAAAIGPAGLAFLVSLPLPFEDREVVNEVLHSVEASAASCWVVRSAIAAVMALSLSARGPRPPS